MRGRLLVSQDGATSFARIGKMPIPRLPVATIAFVLFCLGCTVASAAPVFDRARAEFRREVAIETFGLFWIGAELAILFCMGVAVRVFAERPVPLRLALKTDERRRAVLWTVGFAGLVIAVYVRHAFLPPLPVVLQSIAATSEAVVQDARDAYLARANLHTALWCAFIAGWVVLEIAIVVQGIRAYRRLARVIEETRHAA
jgi:hypothetical protein